MTVCGCKVLVKQWVSLVVFMFVLDNSMGNQEHAGNKQTSIIANERRHPYSTICAMETQATGNWENCLYLCLCLVLCLDVHLSQCKENSTKVGWMLNS